MEFGGIGSCAFKSFKWKTVGNNREFLNKKLYGIFGHEKY